MKATKLKNDEIRVIRIKKDAIREFIFETIMEKGESLFNINDITKVTFETHFDMEEGDLISVIHKRNFKLGEINFDYIANAVKETTGSMFSPDNKYISLKIEDGVFQRREKG